MADALLGLFGMTALLFLITGVVAYILYGDSQS